MPWVNVSSAFRKGNKPGETILILDIQGKIVGGNINIGNTSTNASGPNVGTVSMDINTMPVVGANTTISYSQAASRKDTARGTLAEFLQMLQWF